MKFKDYLLLKEADRDKLGPLHKLPELQPKSTTDKAPQATNAQPRLDHMRYLQIPANAEDSYIECLIVGKYLPTYVNYIREFFTTEITERELPAYKEKNPVEFAPEDEGKPFMVRMAILKTEFSITPYSKLPEDIKAILVQSENERDPVAYIKEQVPENLLVIDRLSIDYFKRTIADLITITLRDTTKAKVRQSKAGSGSPEETINAVRQILIPFIKDLSPEDIDEINEMVQGRLMDALIERSEEEPFEVIEDISDRLLELKPDSIRDISKLKDSLNSRIIGTAVGDLSLNTVDKKIRSQVLQKYKQTLFNMPDETYNKIINALKPENAKNDPTYCEAWKNITQYFLGIQKQLGITHEVLLGHTIPQYYLDLLNDHGYELASTLSTAKKGVDFGTVRRTKESESQYRAEMKEKNKQKRDMKKIISIEHQVGIPNIERIAEFKDYDENGNVSKSIYFSAEMPDDKDKDGNSIFSIYLAHQVRPGEYKLDDGFEPITDLDEDSMTEVLDGLMEDEKQEAERREGEEAPSIYLNLFKRPEKPKKEDQRSSKNILNVLSSEEFRDANYPGSIDELDRLGLANSYKFVMLTRELIAKLRYNINKHHKNKQWERIAAIVSNIKTHNYFASDGGLANANREYHYD